MAVILGDKTPAELTEHFGAYLNQISKWKQQLMEAAVDVFGGPQKARTVKLGLEVLRTKMGQLTHWQEKLPTSSRSRWPSNDHMQRK